MSTPTPGGDTPKHYPPPPRGTRDYYRAIHRAAEAEDLDRATELLHVLWGDYGWRSTVDVMTEWICAIDYIIPDHPRYRDFTGTVNPSWWAPEKYLSEDRMLAMAVRHAAASEQEDGLSPHESFAHSSKVTDRLRTNVLRWETFLRQGLRTAHTTRERDAVRAVLSRGPGIRERDWWTLRDGAAYLYQVASWPMTAARQLGKPLRPPEMEWLANDTTVPPHMIMSLLPPGELSSEH